MGQWDDLCWNEKKQTNRHEIVNVKMCQMHSNGSGKIGMSGFLRNNYKYVQQILHTSY